MPSKNSLNASNIAIDLGLEITSRILGRSPCLQIQRDLTLYLGQFLGTQYLNVSGNRQNDKGIFGAETFPSVIRDF